MATYNKKSPVEMEKIKQIKITRTMLRLKHTLEYDEEVNEILPELITQFDASIQAGEIKELTEETVRKLLD